MTEICPVCRMEVAPGLGACPTCGFRLLGKTQAFKPISLGESDEMASPAPVTEAALKVVRGPQRGVVYQLGDESLTLGRSPQCSIFLNDMTVSRLHASLRREGGCYVITDENSYNGVWVNNRNVETKALASGDFIQIGTFCLLYEEKAR